MHTNVEYSHQDFIVHEKISGKSHQEMSLVYSLQVRRVAPLDYEQHKTQNPNVLECYLT
jgi:hypothetical protein